MNPVPFQSYCRAFFQNDSAVAYEILNNLAFFVPLGAAMGMLLENRAIGNTLILGMLLSSAVETLQVINRCGLFEVDDIISNCTGCIIGYIIASTGMLFWGKSSGVSAAAGIFMKTDQTPVRLRMNTVY